MGSHRTFPSPVRGQGVAENNRVSRNLEGGSESNDPLIASTDRRMVHAAMCQ